MKFSMKVLCVALMTMLSLGSVLGMRPARPNTRGNGRSYPPVQVVRQPQKPHVNQRAHDQDLKDYEIAFALQLKEAEQESALEANREQLKRDAEFARSLQENAVDGEDELSDENDDEREASRDNAPLGQDEAYARALQAGYDAENGNPPAPAPVPSKDVPVANEDSECEICNEVEANVWLLCCTKKVICQGCFKKAYEKDKNCPFCRQVADPVCECITCINNAKAKNL